MSADAFIKNELVTLRKTIKQKQWWFSKRVNYKMHRQRNTLTVYDYAKLYIRPRSNNISVELMKVHYSRLADSS
jgi:hypothetical protein